ncbi:MAG: hypothetical protein L0210_00495 [Rhodospirillales bacterium]|nr:hypothetical protein [Rhodospirillales bacterium]
MRDRFGFCAFGSENSVSNSHLLMELDSLIAAEKRPLERMQQVLAPLGIDPSAALTRVRPPVNPRREPIYVGKIVFENWEQPTPDFRVALPNVFVPYLAARLRRHEAAWRGEQLPGGAHDIALSGDGTLWVVGTDPVPGGFGLWRWTGAWERLPEPFAATRIAGGMARDAWVVNDAQEIWHVSGDNAERFPGGANDIAMGGDGTLWVVGTDAVPGGFGLWRWTGTWERLPKPFAATRITAGPAQDVWVVNDLQEIWYLDGTRAERLPGGARDIAMGPDGTLWVVGTDSAPGGYGLWRWNGGGWRRLPEPLAAAQIAAGAAQDAWVVNDLHEIWHITA